MGLEKKERSMVARVLAVAVIATVSAATSPVLAQPAQAPSQSAEAPLVGLAVYSSDGQKLGEVTHARFAGNQSVIRAEFGNVLGIGPVAVIIPAAMFVQKTDRIEMRMTAAEVKDEIAKQRQQEQKE
jgi:hypothetical protein